ncbi:hypothetical protein QWJ90_06310 [Microbacterium oryzae]|uniref:hypothetical protein n=1 Tax=Microbacterium oryzae TaxID=743009 RepID=UPI0025B097E3|nr:hypothetical protein [Microbacterium oryzae]MDN3310537.1 hypothetical protein [Microbacterium oryzae]
MTIEVHAGMQDEAPVVAAVRQAKAHSRSADVIDGVKTAVIDELKRLDPTLKIKTTEYFNHSYVPDLIAFWREEGKERERRVFIRGSLSSVVAARDVESLADQEPLLIGLGDEKKKVLADLRKQLPSSTRTLATEVTATSRIPTLARDEERDTQLSGLVRANIVRGGRGLLSDKAADRIAAVEEGEPVEALKAFQTTVRQLFTGATADRLNRTAGLLVEFFKESPTRETLDSLREKPLLDGELRVVLPYVLRRAAEVSAAEVWEALASMLTLERLESMAPVLADLDVTPIVKRATRLMTAGRSALYPNPTIADDEQAASPASWKVRNGRLVADVHRWALWMGSDARKVRARDDGTDARWDELSAPLRNFDLTAIELHGLSRQLAVANENPDTVREDVERIRETIEDDFHVAAVTVREKGDDDAGEVKVEFEAATATGKATVDFHVRAAALLGIRRPLTDEDIEALTGE